MSGRPLARRSALLGSAAAVAALLGCSARAEGSGAGAGASTGATGSPTPRPASPAATGTPPPATAEGAVPAPGDPSRAVDSAMVPVRLEVPRIGVDVPLITLGTNPDGTLEVPADYQQVGWFTGGAAPGATGPAVIAGHVDSSSGPAPFHRLRDLAAGDEVVVTAADGRRRSFAVDGVEQHPKDAFPTAAVYGPAPGPVLRLITCGGSFDRAIGHYRDNVVVFAS
ncbi:pyruvate/2-oxoglutarate dehydrogenase complex dihydrolipoamide acyltransferase (E2) component [Kineococcus radiotolerans]|uniref:Pyruvate/2-oxoglutarate dehydrogenase complex dihydrolipoamide acyltransferase (E2) component n=1 Tax=Kineococcus radiotolerans TaxID=131568 RepID=A0A7W4XX31_KINRA|nr:class F sortase [Kineococcus radiotolerans]MBB2900735.1 pyruvate/2-oxoglutarate dehydrogenase complex dihydrolipoamide acyltransferase (E2) component [Kineococcus radiotolerans]